MDRRRGKRGREVEGRIGKGSGRKNGERVDRRRGKRGNRRRKWK